MLFDLGLLDQGQARRQECFQSSDFMGSTETIEIGHLMMIFMVILMVILTW